MSAITDSFQRVVGPSVSFGGGGGGSSGPSYFARIRARALAERQLAEEMDPMLREERFSREGVAGVLRGMREGREIQRKAFFESAGQQGKQPSEASWRYDQAMRGTGEGRGILLNQIMSMDYNDPMRRVYQERLTKATQAAERQW
jgi:hypothetical protein